MVSPITRIVLWARSAGRCQFPGCNHVLIGDLVSGNSELNCGYVAHIVAETPGGPRGDPVRSPLLADDVGNLMLLCDAHHREIDRNHPDYPEAMLLDIKERHEARIAAVTDILADRSTHVLLFGARVGAHDFPVRFDLAKTALLPDRYPAENVPIQIDMQRVEFEDHEPAYWVLQVENLRRQFRSKVRDRLRSGHIRHLSLFALAPQPLLIELGCLLSDIAGVAVHQLHREPQDWRWRLDRLPVEFGMEQSNRRGKRVALKITLSATINDDRVTSVLGADAPIWSITTPHPHNDLMHQAEDLARFRQTVRATLDQIKAIHGEDAEIHLFPAAPVSAAVEFGRVWMPKADLPIVIYDQTRGAGFVVRHWIGTPAPTNPVKEPANV